MSNWDMCRTVGRGVLIVGLMMQSTPLAWAQVEGGWEAVDVLVDQAIPAGELHDIAADLVEQCQANEQVARGVEVEAQVIIEASEKTSEVLDTVASDPNRIVTTLQNQGVTVSPEALTKLTEAAANASRTLREGSTVMDPRVAEHLGAIREAMEAMARSAGLSDARELERFFAGGPPGAETEGRFREMGFLVESAMGDAVKAHFEAEMERHAAGGMGMPPRELLEQIAVAGYNPREIMRDVAIEMAALGAPSEAMIADAQTHMETMLADPNIPQAEKDRMSQMFSAWESGNFAEVVGTMSAGMDPMGGAHSVFDNPAAWEAMGVNYTEMMASNPDMARAMIGGFEYMGPAGFETYAAAGTTEFHTAFESYTQDLSAQQAELVQQFQDFQDVHSPGSGVAHALVVEHNEPEHQEGHWDSNSDGIADHTHPLGTASH